MFFFVKKRINKLIKVYVMDFNLTERAVNDSASARDFAQTELLPGNRKEEFTSGNFQPSKLKMS
jgi:hypothetical protein